MTEPEDAVPPQYQTPPTPDPNAARRQRLAEHHRRNFITGARIVGVRLNDTLTEIWSHGFGQPHYPITPAVRAHTEEDGEILVFEGPDYELVVKVPKGGRRYARGFAGEFNTWIKQQS